MYVTRMHETDVLSAALDSGVAISIILIFFWCVVSSSISHLHVVPILSSKYPIIHSTIYPISSISSVPRQPTRPPSAYPTIIQPIHLLPTIHFIAFFSSSYQTCIPIPRAHADKQLLSSICFLPRPHMPICMPSRYTFRWRCLVPSHSHGRRRFNNWKFY